MAIASAAEILEQEEDTQKGKFLTFFMGRETYGIEIRYVTEIIGIHTITEVPELPAYVRGIINLRGKIIPVMDVRLKFKKPFKAYDDRTCIVVVDMNGIAIGLIVDHVADVLTIPAAEMVEPPALDKGHGSNYIQAIGKIQNEVILLLDINQLLTDDELGNVHEAAI